MCNLLFHYSSIESDHGRSVSFSSDKFPPPELVHARLHHTDKIPYSPLAMSNYDMSMPPPPTSTLPPTTSCPLTLPKTTSANAILSSGSQLGSSRSTHKTAQRSVFRNFFRKATILNIQSWAPGQWPHVTKIFFLMLGF